MTFNLAEFVKTFKWNGNKFEKQGNNVVAKFFPNIPPFKKEKIWDYIANISCWHTSHGKIVLVMYGTMQKEYMYQVHS